MLLTRLVPANKAHQRVLIALSTIAPIIAVLIPFGSASYLEYTLFVDYDLVTGKESKTNISRIFALLILAPFFMLYFRRPFPSPKRVLLLSSLILLIAALELLAFSRAYQIYFLTLLVINLPIGIGIYLRINNINNKRSSIPILIPSSIAFGELLLYLFSPFSIVSGLSDNIGLVELAHISRFEWHVPVTMLMVLLLYFTIILYGLNLRFGKLLYHVLPRTMYLLPLIIFISMVTAWPHYSLNDIFGFLKCVLFLYSLLILLAFAFGEILVQSVHKRQHNPETASTLNT